MTTGFYGETALHQSNGLGLAKIVYQGWHRHSLSNVDIVYNEERLTRMIAKKIYVLTILEPTTSVLWIQYINMTREWNYIYSLAKCLITQRLNDIEMNFDKTVYIISEMSRYFNKWRPKAIVALTDFIRIVTFRWPSVV